MYRHSGGKGIPIPESPLARAKYSVTLNFSFIFSISLSLCTDSLIFFWCTCSFLGSLQSWNLFYDPLILLHSGCSNRTSQTGGAYKPRKLISPGSWGWKPKIKGPAGVVSGETPFLVHRRHLLTVGTWQERAGRPAGLFYKDTKSHHEGSTFMNSSPPKGPAS